MRRRLASWVGYRSRRPSRSVSTRRRDQYGASLKRTDVTGAPTKRRPLRRALEVLNQIDVAVRESADRPSGRLQSRLPTARTGQAIRSDDAYRVGSQAPVALDDLELDALVLTKLAEA